ncbi:MAG: beta-ketoacyl-[acyl-carrier-protein] synthase family protein [bacterium]
MKRVVVTGLGVVTPIGIGKDEFWENLCQGKSGVEGETAEVRDFEIKQEYVEYDRSIQFALKASAEALVDSGLFGALERDEERAKAGVIIGSSKGGLGSLMQEMAGFVRGGPAAVSGHLYDNFLPNMAASRVAAAFGFHGPSEGIAAACATGAIAIIQAYNLIREGRAEVMLAGATEASLVPLILAGFRNMGVISSSLCRPFDRNRDGFIPGEGCGVVVLESLERAEKRGAKVYAQIKGYALAADACHPTTFHPSGVSIAGAIKRALHQAQLHPSEIDYINAHGTGTRHNDPLETRGIKMALGEDAFTASLSSTKPLTGHLLGAAGSVEFIVCLLAMEVGFVPPTINLKNPDPECDLDYTPLKGKSRHIRNALSLSFGFGGHISVLIASNIEYLIPPVCYWSDG